MIVPHRFIDELTEAQVFRILKMLGDWTKNNRKGGLNLPRYPIDLTGAPAEVNIARLLLHAAVEENNTLTVVFRKFLFTEQVNLRNEKENIQNELPDTKDWTLYAAWILIYLNNELSVEFKNQMWQVECKSERMLGISEIRDLLQIIRFDMSKLNTQVLVMPHAKVNEIVMGDKFGNITNSTVVNRSENITVNAPKNEKIEAISSETQKTLQNIVSNGRIEEALEKLLELFKNNGNKYALNEAIMYNSQFSQLRTQQNFNTISHDDASRETARITKAIIDLIQRAL